jgi:uncharacterized protein with HEPN domain
MPKDDMIYIRHMLETTRKAIYKVTGKNRADFDTYEDLRIVLTHLVQIIGEAALHVSADFQDSHKTIPWKAIMGMRHKIVHDYLNVDEDILWDTVTNELVTLAANLETLIQI